MVGAALRLAASCAVATAFRQHLTGPELRALREMTYEAYRELTGVNLAALRPSEQGGDTPFEPFHVE